ncbi:uncharacterized protein LOC132462549 [Gadus macrocephalus]|uniref:uncharacterized protein LOC132462549 n=1 Tax=Gadus macrocephalus TaxID=80720 RepID=UPI0028CB6FED|nr:uncharacterized protein LOC132462549 [Gadus macrocephalus]XP_059914102.1 uncharacterized protein LOC132462549 [Gadus macrocephalus]
MAVDSGQNLVLPALGRPCMGLLYDFRKDSLIPALTYWDREPLEKEEDERPQPNSDQAEASVKASFLCELVWVEDSSTFLSDCTISSNQSRVTNKYNKPYEFESGKATHVEKGILYGAYFVFDHEVSEKEDRQERKGKLTGMYNRTKMEGQDSLMGDTHIANVEKFYHKFHGDTYHYKPNQNVSKWLGINRENAVPQKVWLKPLKIQNLYSDDFQLVQQIGEILINDAQNALKVLQQMEDGLFNIQAYPQITKDFARLVSKSVSKLETLIKSTSRIAPVPNFKEILKELLSSLYLQRKFEILCTLNDIMPNMAIITSYKDLQLEVKGDRPTVCLVLPSFVESTGQHDLLISEVMDKVLEKAKLFKDFAEANKENENIKFLIAAISDDRKNRATLHLYKNGSLDNDDFEPPSKPEMTLGDITHNSVTLNISPPQFGLTTVTHYTVEFRARGCTTWYRRKENKAGHVTVLDLQMNKEYQFRCKANCAVGLSQACEALIKTLPYSPQEKLQVERHSTDLSVSWEKPTELGHGVEIKDYIVEYAETFSEQKHEELTWKKLQFQGNRVTISLQPSTSYTIKVRCDTGHAGLGIESEVSRTNKRESGIQKIKKLSTFMEGRAPEVFRLPLERNNNGIDGSESYTFGQNNMKQNYTIMFLGETGSGKSTLINGMINHILGIDWTDSFRFKIKDEGPLKSQTESQTTHITVYKVNHQDWFKIPYSVTLIDTPGFGSTRGKESDWKFTEKISSFLNSAKGVLKIDKVCLVTQASLAKLTPAQKNVFDSVTSIFGKDVAKKICMLVTFADGQLPPVLEAINASNVPCPKTKNGLPLHFKFNNSALFADNRSVHDRIDEDCDEGMDVEPVDEMFWKMGAKNMNRFFTALEKMTNQSTKEFPNEQSPLEAEEKEGIPAQNW